MISKLLLNTRVIWMMSIKILKNTIQVRNSKILIAFDDMIVDMLSNKKFNPIVMELFIWGKKTKHFFCFYWAVLFWCTKKLNSTYYLIMKVRNKPELQQIAFNHLSDIDFKDFINLCKNWICTAKPYSFLKIHATLAWDNLLCLRKNLLETI